VPVAPPNSVHGLSDERRFELLVNGVLDHAIYLLDAEGRVASWNSGAERIKQYRADEILGSHFSRFFTGEDRAAGQPELALEKAARTGRYEAEGWRVRKDGTEFRALGVLQAIRDPAGALIGFAKITRDISERQEFRQALIESERSFRLLVDGVVDYAIYMIDPSGIVSNWNKGAERIKGYSADEIVGRHFGAFYTEADQAAGLPQRALGIAGREGRYDAEGWRVRKNGELFWASVVIDAIQDESGRLIGFAKITRDMTERREAQLALARAQEQLALTQKMEALGQLTGGVAHDFNNLLMVIGGHTELLRRRIAEARDLRSLEAIELATSRGQSLTRQLLSFARRQPMNPQAVDLRERLAHTQDLLLSSLGRSVAIRLSVGPEVWPVRVDPAELELALLNLAVNARDAMPSGGTFTIRGENMTLKAGAQSMFGLEGDYVALSVADTGAGIPPDVLPKIFDPFFTTKDVDKGTGLGLAHVYGFTKASGGAVHAESEVGKGTRITILLPRETAAADALRSTSARFAANPGAKVLVVEDNPDVALVSCEMLDQLGYRTVAVNSGDAGLRKLDSGEEKFDLVFSDIVMAGQLDGLALARIVRERYPGLPILLASGYNKATEGASGEFEILSKPYRIGDLDQAIGRLLAAQR
jgi:PAS domain S-box-containing protein